MIDRSARYGEYIRRGRSYDGSRVPVSSRIVLPAWFPGDLLRIASFPDSLPDYLNPFFFFSSLFR